MAFDVFMCQGSGLAVCRFWALILHESDRIFVSLFVLFVRMSSLFFYGWLGNNGRETFIHLPIVVLRAFTDCDDVRQYDGDRLR